MKITVTTAIQKQKFLKNHEIQDILNGILAIPIFIFEAVKSI